MSPTINPSWAILALLATGGALLLVQLLARHRRRLTAARELRNHEHELARLELEAADVASRAREVASHMRHRLLAPVEATHFAARRLAQSQMPARERFLLDSTQAGLAQLQETLADVGGRPASPPASPFSTETEFTPEAVILEAVARRQAAGSLITFLSASPLPGRLRGDATALAAVLRDLLALHGGVCPGREITLQVTIAPSPNDDSTLTAKVSSPRAAGDRRCYWPLLARPSPTQTSTIAPRETPTPAALALNATVDASGGRLRDDCTTSTLALSVELPVQIVALPAAAASEPSAHADVQVLGVEDEPFNRILLGKYFTALGLNVDWARTAPRAIEWFGRNRYDLLLVDWHLPGMTGGELLARFRTLRPGPLPPVIAMSAEDSIAQRDEALAAGAVAFLAKPITEEALGAAVRRWLPLGPPPPDAHPERSAAPPPAPSPRPPHE